MRGRRFHGARGFISRVGPLAAGPRTCPPSCCLSFLDGQLGLEERARPRAAVGVSILPLIVIFAFRPFAGVFAAAVRFSLQSCLLSGMNILICQCMWDHCCGVAGPDGGKFCDGKELTSEVVDVQ